jgi:hypothetical protein
MRTLILDPSVPAVTPSYIQFAPTIAATGMAYHLAGFDVSSAFSVQDYEEADDLEDEFNELADEWQSDTRFSSSPQQIASHPAYLRIIGFGDRSVALILNDLRQRDGLWFVALRAITGASPAPAAVAGNMPAIRDAWLDWGRRHGYIIR